MDTKQTNEQHMASLAERSARALEAIKVAVWILAGLAIAGVVYGFYLATSA